MTGWLVPSLVYIAFLGSLGVTTKLALEHVSCRRSSSGRRSSTC